MKLKYLFLTITAALMAGCSDELDRGRVYNPKEEITAIIPLYQFEDGTRVAISDDLQNFTWNDNDMLGIYYSGNDLDVYARYTIKHGGSSSGTFGNDVLFMNPGKTYYAFFPYDSNARVNAAPVDFTGQVQTENGSASHIGAYNYMYGKVNIDQEGNASVNFNNLGSIMHFVITAPIYDDYQNPIVYTRLRLTSLNTSFTTKGVANMTTGSISSTETHNTLTLTLGTEGFSPEGDNPETGTITANLLVAPIDLSESNIRLTLITSKGQMLPVNIQGKKMEAGKAYLYEGIANLEPPYLTFTADQEQTMKMSGGCGSETLPGGSGSFQYSLNGGSWAPLGTSEITFGGDLGELRLRGNNEHGTAFYTYKEYESDDGRSYFEEAFEYSTIEFGNNTPVSCSGDIRTLLDYENYFNDYSDYYDVSFTYLFYGCTQLTSAPDLPMTGGFLTEYIEISDIYGFYQSMFAGCTSLLYAPELPATRLGYSCYKGMFAGCTSLRSAPELPASTLSTNCYQNMFYGCTSLRQVPELLPATKLVNSCYYNMFNGCTSLTKAPELPATKLADKCYYYMFNGCTSLTQAPELPATTLADNCYSYMFNGCTSLTEAPELPATTLAQLCYASMFSGCTALTKAPSKLPATSLTSYCYSHMFSNCTSLTAAPELPATTLATYCYQYMFDGCSSLTRAPEKLPASTLMNYCYSYMFQNCSSLAKAPVLPAETLTSYCYYYMFYGCSNLSYIKMKATNTSANYCLSNWVRGVSSSGTFVKATNANIKTGISGIPSGWAVETED